MGQVYYHKKDNIGDAIAMALQMFSQSYERNQDKKKAEEIRLAHEKKEQERYDTELGRQKIADERNATIFNRQSDEYNKKKEADDTVASVMTAMAQQPEYSPNIAGVFGGIPVYNPGDNPKITSDTEGFKAKLNPAWYKAHGNAMDRATWENITNIDETEQRHHEEVAQKEAETREERAFRKGLADSDHKTQLKIAGMHYGDYDPSGTGTTGTGGLRTRGNKKLPPDQQVRVDVAKERINSLLEERKMIQGHKYDKDANLTLINNDLAENRRAIDAAARAVEDLLDPNAKQKFFEQFGLGGDAETPGAPGGSLPFAPRVDASGSTGTSTTAPASSQSDFVTNPSPVYKPQKVEKYADTSIAEVDPIPSNTDLISENANAIPGKILGGLETAGTNMGDIPSSVGSGLAQAGRNARQAPGAIGSGLQLAAKNATSGPSGDDIANEAYDKLGIGKDIDMFDFAKFYLWMDRENDARSERHIPELSKEEARILYDKIRKRRNA
jgi:hypothetical protein